MVATIDGQETGNRCPSEFPEGPVGTVGEDALDGAPLGQIVILPDLRGLRKHGTQFESRLYRAEETIDPLLTREWSWGSRALPSRSDA